MIMILLVVVMSCSPYRKIREIRSGNVGMLLSVPEDKPLEEDDPDEYFSVNKADITVEGSSMGLLPGDKVTLRILAKGMLLASGNDAANAAAKKISGSMEKFVQLMNKRAKEMGLESTSFKTPSGLDGENHFSTALDMAILAKNALKNPDFAEICGSKSMTAEYGNPPYSRKLFNHNRLLKTLEGARIKVQETIMNGSVPVDVIFRGGEYRFNKTVSFTELDSGTKEAPITYKAMENENFRFVKADIRDAEAVDKLFAEEKPDIVVNFAAESHVDRSIEEPEVFLKTNILGTQVMMDACRKYGINEMMMTSWSSSNLYANLLGLSMAAELCYTENPSEDQLRERFFACT